MATTPGMGGLATAMSLHRMGMSLWLELGCIAMHQLFVTHLVCHSTGDQVAQQNAESLLTQGNLLPYCQELCCHGLCIAQEMWVNGWVLKLSSCDSVTLGAKEITKAMGHTLQSMCGSEHEMTLTQYICIGGYT